MPDQSLTRLREWALAADLGARRALHDVDTDAVEYARGEAESYAWWWLHGAELATADGSSLQRLMGWAESLAAADRRLSLDARAEGRRAATGRVLRVVAFGKAE